MSRIFSACLGFMLLLIAPIASASLVVLSYHDVDDGPLPGVKAEAMTVSHASLIEQFSWLHANGYQVVGVDDLIAANEGRQPLPDKSVMLTFDDGYRSMYDKVFPLLKLFNYRAVLAVTGQWLETPPDESVAYGTGQLPRDRFLRWDQIQEMVGSGLVELASHSFDMHRGVLSNPQGNLQPAATTFEYDPKLKRYETEDEYRARIHADLKRNNDLIEDKAGQSVRVMVWPYGAYNQVTIDVANQLGMPVAMSLDNGHTDIERLDNVNRLLIGMYSDAADFVWLINDHIKQFADPVRVVHVDLDYVYDIDPIQQARNLDLLLDRIKHLGISTVYLQAFADADGDGNANALYFPNRHMPMKADLFDRVSWQLKTRAGVDVYAWMPVLAFDLDDKHPLAAHRVRSTLGVEHEAYRRLSPFSHEALRFVGDLYEDLAKYSKIKGLVFHDDAYLGDYEDVSEWAMKAYQQAGFAHSIDDIKNDPAEFERWTLFKSVALARWTDALRDRASLYQMQLKTARNMYASVVMEPHSVAWFAQSMEVFLQHYDYTAIMAMPYMENAKDPEQWLITLVDKISKIPGALDKTIFELQSVDWRISQAVPAADIAEHMRLLQSHGAKHYGYYPDDFIKGHPAIEVIRPAFSLSKEPVE